MFEISFENSIHQIDPTTLFLFPKHKFPNIAACDVLIYVENCVVRCQSIHARTAWQCATRPIQSGRDRSKVFPRDNLPADTGPICLCFISAARKGERSPPHQQLHSLLYIRASDIKCQAKMPIVGRSCSSAAERTRMHATEHIIKPNWERH
jgi:hypothetical protein